MVYRCMPLFLPYVHSSFSLCFYHLVLFLVLWFSISLLLLFLCVLPLSLLFLPLFLFIPLCSMGFLPFIPRTSPTIFGSLWASLQACPLTHWLPRHYLCSECACCTTLHSQKKFLVLFLLPPSFLCYL